MDSDDLHMRAGITRVAGPGIVITLDDAHIAKLTPDTHPNAGIIHDIDLLILVNELREAGAKAIAINDHRLTGNTAIRYFGRVIHVNDHPIKAPYTLTAIGNSETLYGAVNMPLGVLDQLREIGIHIAAEKKEQITVPASATAVQAWAWKN